jgi:hypothetical protein
VIGEASKSENQIRYPMNEAYEATRADRWVAWPKHQLGAHDGKPKTHGQPSGDKAT